MLATEALLFQFIVGIDVLEIDHDGARHLLFELPQVQRTELLPFGDDHKSVGSFRTAIRAVAKRHLGKDFPRLLHARGIEGAHARAHILQRRDQGD
jgi:hypothetical protein